MKPIHKLNGGIGATLCNKCSIIISTGFTNDVICKTCELNNANYMRVVERIDIFLKLIDWDYLRHNWEVDTDFEDIIKNTGVVKYWKENPDLRFGQLLINEGYVDNELHIWLDEEDELLQEQGIHPREFLLWGSIFNKNRKLLDKWTFRKIKDLSNNHIENILKEINKTSHYFSLLNEELKYREENNIFIPEYNEDNSKCSEELGEDKERSNE